MNSEQDSGIIMENGSNNHNNNNTLDNFENDFYGGVRSKSNLSSGDEVKKSPNWNRFLKFVITWECL